jgi:hypothetical protein
LRKNIFNIIKKFSQGYIGASLGGVVTGSPKGENKVLLVSARSWLMVYHLQFYPQNVSFLSGLWEKEFQRRVQNYSSENVTVTCFHSQVYNCFSIEKNSKYHSNEKCGLIPVEDITFSVISISSN